MTPAEIIGAVDRLGYAYCAPCAARLDIRLSAHPGDQDAEGYPFPVMDDNAAFLADRCDRCDGFINMTPRAIEERHRMAARMMAHSARRPA